MIRARSPTQIAAWPAMGFILVWVGSRTFYCVNLTITNLLSIFGPPDNLPEFMEKLSPDSTTGARPRSERFRDAGFFLCRRVYGRARYCDSGPCQARPRAVDRFCRQPYVKFLTMRPVGLGSFRGYFHRIAAGILTGGSAAL